MPTPSVETPPGQPGLENLPQLAYEQAGDRAQGPPSPGQSRPLDPECGQLVGEVERLDVEDPGADERSLVIASDFDVARQDLGIQRRGLAPYIAEVCKGGIGMADVLETGKGQRVTDGLGEPQAIKHETGRLAVG